MRPVITRRHGKTFYKIFVKPSVVQERLSEDGLFYISKEDSEMISIIDSVQYEKRIYEEYIWKKYYQEERKFFLSRGEEITESILEDIVSEEDLEQFESDIPCKNNSKKTNILREDLEVIATKDMTSISGTFSEYVENYQNGDEDKKNILEILYQIMVVVRYFNRKRFIHNDLHLKNILVIRYRVKKTIVIGEEKFESFFRIKLIDFDRSYISYMGNNPFLDSYTKKKWSQSNTICYKRDPLKILNCMYYIMRQKETSHSFENIFQTLLLKKIEGYVLEKDWDLVKIAFTNNYLLIDPYTEETLERTRFYKESIQDIDHIVDKIHKYVFFTA